MSSQTSANTAAHKTHKQLPRPPFECIALLLQGGGAPGAYQAGVKEIARSFAEAVAIADRNAAAADELRGAGTRSLGIGHGCHE